MAEPEGLLIEGARLATSAARDLWRRRSPPDERSVLPLASVRQRLELFLRALYAEAPLIVPTDPPPAPVWLARLMGRAPRHLTPRTALASTDGARIWLPRALDARPSQKRMTPMECALERLVQAVLSADPSAPAPDLPSAATPSASRAWARDMARRVRVAGGHYRGVAVAPLWGRCVRAHAPPECHASPPARDPRTRGRPGRRESGDVDGTARRAHGERRRPDGTPATHRSRRGRRSG